MTLRKEMMKKNPSALSVAYVARGIFYSRPMPEGEDNLMIAFKKEYEATGEGLSNVKKRQRSFQAPG